MTTRTPAVQLTGVTKDFGRVHAVRGIDLEIQPGEIVAFLGPNGAGKTTTIDMILGLSHPTSGRRRGLRHGPAPRDRPRAGGRGDADRRSAQGPHRPRDGAATPPASSPTPSRPTRCSRSAGIAEIADRKVAKCSGGEQQRLRFAMALLSDPALLLLDEPTTGMDVEGRRSFWQAIRARRRARPLGAVRDALPRGGRPVRRPDHPGQQRPRRRRRHRQRDQVAGERAHGPGHHDLPRHLGPVRPGGCGQRRGAGRAGAGPRQGQRHGRALPPHRDRRARPRDHRARAWRTPSSA